MRFISISEHLLALSGTGMLAMGIMNWIGDDDAGPEDVSADGGDDLFGELESDDDFGSMDDDFGDDFGDVGGDDWGGGFDDGGGGGGGSDQLFQDVENRVDGLENEVAEVSSTINTVRSENEEISETVEEIEENVRKLLEIYEMVTRGVNPFVDDVQEPSHVGGSAFGGDFGLFGDGENDEPDRGNDLDEDIMEADAESFFDDDALDDFEDDGLEVELEEDQTPADSGGGGGGGSAASSFQELKAEYESGEADWADDDIDEPLTADVTADSGDGDGDAEFEVEIDLEPEETVIDDESVSLGETEGGTSVEEQRDESVDVADDEFEFAETVEEPPATDRSTGRSDEKPYLETLPAGYVVDLVVMEWLEFLIEEFGAEQAVRTIQYYERIEWISESVSEHLLAFLEGLASVEANATDDLGPVELDIDDHIQSLTFISQLTGDSMDRKIVDHCARIRGEGRGIQR